MSLFLWLSSILTPKHIYTYAAARFIFICASNINSVLRYFSLFFFFFFFFILCKTRRVYDNHWYSEGHVEVHGKSAWILYRIRSLYFYLFFSICHIFLLYEYKLYLLHIREIVMVASVLVEEENCVAQKNIKNMIKVDEKFWNVPLGSVFSRQKKSIFQFFNNLLQQIEMCIVNFGSDLTKKKKKNWLLCGVYNVQNLRSNKKCAFNTQLNASTSWKKKQIWFSVN